LLVVLTWLGVAGVVWSYQKEAQAHASAVVTNEALAFEAQVRRQLLAIDQTLRIMQVEWRRDPEHFDLHLWASQIVAITDVALHVFLTDQRGIVRATTRPEILGTDVSRRAYFQHESALPTDDGRMFIGDGRGPLSKGAPTEQPRAARGITRSS
jgi:hypothetical protein